jgi:hypothetical protein
MKTLGSTMEKFLSLIIFKIILVLFIVLTALKITGVILVENISGVSARKKALVEEVNQSLIGKNITDPVQNSKNKFTRTIISLHDSVGKTNYEETRQLFLNNVLTEALDTGEPRYYNSNVLGRYYRKDYFHGNSSD